MLNISDAQPIQFWPTDCNTYNQEDAAGVHHRCFEALFNCDDEIAIQFTSNEVSENEVAISLPALSSWTTTQLSSNPDWVEGAAPEVTIEGAGVPFGITSEILYAEYSFIEGRQYTITLDYTKVVNVSDSNPRTILLAFFDDSFNILSSQSGTTPSNPGGSAQVVFTALAPANCTKIGIRATDGSDVTITIDSVSGTVTTTDEYVLSIRNTSGVELLQLSFDDYDDGAKYVFNVSLIPSESSPAICDTTVLFYIRNATTGTDRAKSDPINIAESHANTLLINYYNHRNFAGLVYEDFSPQLSFNLRVSAIFFHERFPEEEETIELTSSSVTINATVKKQKLLSIDFVPYYFHEKLKLILVHQFVYINSKYWVKQEPYEIASGDRRWPVKQASCWISQSDFVHRNVL